MIENLSVVRLSESLAPNFPHEGTAVISFSMQDSGASVLVTCSDRTLDRLNDEALREVGRLAGKLTVAFAQSAQHYFQAIAFTERSDVAFMYEESQGVMASTPVDFSAYAAQLRARLEEAVHETQRRLSALLGAELLVESACKNAVTVRENINYRPREWATGG